VYRDQVQADRRVSRIQAGQKKAAFAKGKNAQDRQAVVDQANLMRV
jgi:hypothetical protein